jgi:hypothetical protein
MNTTMNTGAASLSDEQILDVLCGHDERPFHRPHGTRLVYNAFEDEYDLREIVLRRVRELIALAAPTPQADAAPNVDGLPPLPAPIEIDWPELHSQALGCGVEDRNIHDRYEAAEYGWQDGVDRAAERVPEEIFTADQMREYARDAIAAGGAQEAMQMLLSKVPIPPNAITFDKGWELLDELQRVALLAASNGEKKNV